MRYIFIAIAFLFATPVFAVQDYTKLFSAPGATFVQYCDSSHAVNPNDEICGYVGDGDFFFGSTTSSTQNVSLFFGGTALKVANTSSSTVSMQWNPVFPNTGNNASNTYALVSLDDLSIESGAVVFKASYIRDINIFYDSYIATTTILWPLDTGSGSSYVTIFSETIDNSSAYGYAIVTTQDQTIPTTGYFCGVFDNVLVNLQSECNSAGFGTQHTLGWDSEGKYDFADTFMFSEFGVHIFDIEGFTPGSNPLRPPVEIDPTACDASVASSTIGLIICTSFDLLLRPSDSALGFADSTFTLMMSKFPFSYISEIQDIASSSLSSSTSTITIPILNVNGTTTNYALFDNAVYNGWVSDSTETAIRLFILYVLWIGFAYSIYRTVNKKETLS